MSEGKSIYAYQARFADQHIVVRQISFDPTSGRLALAFDENHEKVGFYYITVIFDSGNSTRIDYDGGNPCRDTRPIVRTPKRDDTVKEIKVIRVRN